MANETKPGITQLQLYLPVAVLDAFKARAVERGVTLRAAATEAIGYWLQVTSEQREASNG